MATLLLRTMCVFSLFFYVAFAQFGHSFFNPFHPLKSLFGGRGVVRGQGYVEEEDYGNKENTYVAELPHEEFGIENVFVTNYLGGWEFVIENAGVCAMHLVVLPNNKAIWFDTTAFGASYHPLPGNRECRRVLDRVNDEVDCSSHAMEFDIETAAIRPLKLQTDTWSSSGGLNADGTLVQTGGWNDGARALRYLKPCDDCDWIDENPQGLASDRWYATQQILPDGSFILVGGRRQFNYEFIPAEGLGNRTNFNLPFLEQTTDISENNLYPFVHLSTDGNLFIFANNRSILLNPNTKKVVREFPPLKGGARNYPGSGMSALLPIKIDGKNNKEFPAQVVVCGGAKHEAAKAAETFKLMTALKDCGRIKITDGDKAQWKIEIMPTPRVMGDMLILPTGDLLMINGAKKGVSGWSFADEPVLSPVLYRPTRPREERFVKLQATTIPRMYHSSSAVLPDGKILVAGSNPNNFYNLTDLKYPTELRVEKFLPPYLDPLLESQRPVIRSSFTNKKIKYGESFMINISLAATDATTHDIKITMYAPPYTTHGFSQGQRQVMLSIQKASGMVPGNKTVSVTAPPSPKTAPPGYYLLSVLYRGVPSKAEWIKLAKR